MVSAGIRHGRYSLRSGLRWLALLLVCALLPLGVALVGAPPNRGFWIEFGAALGLLGLGLMVVQYLTCGPEPLMDIVESTLRAHGADWRRVFSERFEVV